MKINIPSPKHKITKFPDKLSTDNRLTEKEITKIYNCSLTIQWLFQDFNQTVCANCPAAEKMLFGTVVPFEPPPKLTPSQKQRGCCALCAQNNGYFQPLKDYEEGIKQLKEIKEKYGWSKRYGFFDVKNKQCKLPPWRRSMTCLSSCCVSSLAEIALEILKQVVEIKRKHKIIH